MVGNRKDLRDEHRAPCFWLTALASNELIHDGPPTCCIGLGISILKSTTLGSFALPSSLLPLPNSGLDYVAGMFWNRIKRVCRRENPKENETKTRPRPKNRRVARGDN